MINLDVFDVKLLEIAMVSGSEVLSQVEGLILGTVLVIIQQLLQRLHHGVVCWVEEEWNRKPFLIRVNHHPVLHALILVIAPNLYKFTSDMPV